MVRELSSQIGENKKINKARLLRIAEGQEFYFNANVLCWGQFGIIFKMTTMQNLGKRCVYKDDC